MAVSQATKLRWFDRGAAAFERTFPGVIAARFGNVGPLYVCPICETGFSRSTVSAGLLTVDHVPPKSFGGRELLLVCKKCNNDAGTLLDAHARRKENVHEVMGGRPVNGLKVRVEHQGRRVNARLSASTAGWKLDVPAHANNPSTVADFQAAGPPKDSVITVDFAGDRFAELGARLSWFRSGFLALFAAFGYRFSYDPTMKIVKQQLLCPDRRLIYSFTIDVPQSLPWGAWRILTLPEPKCTGVLFGSYVVVFPNSGDTTFYQRLEEHIRANPGKPAPFVTAQSFELAGYEPTFGYEDTAPPEPGSVQGDIEFGS